MIEKTAKLTGMHPGWEFFQFLVWGVVSEELPTSPPPGLYVGGAGQNCIGPTDIQTGGDSSCAMRPAPSSLPPLLERDSAGTANLLVLPY